jgi:hypothetical protein
LPDVRPVGRGESAPVPGVIDTLSAGFQLVNRVPLILAVPVLLDLLLWLGPRLSIASLAERFIGSTVNFVAELARTAGPAAQGQLEQFQTQADALRGAVGTFNLLSLLVFRATVLQSAVPPDRGGLGGTVELGSISTVLGLALLFLLVGILVACVWLGALAQCVRGGRIDALRLLRALPRYWLTILGFIGLVIVGAIALAVPLSILAAIAQVAAPAVGGFLTIFVAVAFQLALIWALVYLFFFEYAVVVSEVGPLRAALSSIRVVASGFWSSLGFIIITWVIMSGMGVIWGSLARAPFGLALAIIGNGYIESGLAAASALFYWNRITRLALPRGAPNPPLRRD